MRLKICFEIASLNAIAPLLLSAIAALNNKFLALEGIALVPTWNFAALNNKFLVLETIAAVATHKVLVSRAIAEAQN